MDKYLKPDWNDAPEWANWVAQDPNGSWWWYEHEPRKGKSRWINTADTMCSQARVLHIDWHNTLEERPRD